MSDAEAFVRVCAAQQVSGRSGHLINVDGQSIALFRVKGVVYAIDSECPHAGGPLEEGQLEGCEVVCPHHGWNFDLQTGECTNATSAPVGTYLVEERDDAIWLKR